MDNRFRYSCNLMWSCSLFNTAVTWAIMDWWYVCNCALVCILSLDAPYHPDCTSKEIEPISKLPRHGCCRCNGIFHLAFLLKIKLVGGMQNMCLDIDIKTLSRTAANLRHSCHWSKIYECRGWKWKEILTVNRYLNERTVNISSKKSK